MKDSVNTHTFGEMLTHFYYFGIREWLIWNIFRYLWVQKLQSFTKFDFRVPIHFLRNDSQRSIDSLSSPDLICAAIAESSFTTKNKYSSLFFPFFSAYIHFNVLVEHLTVKLVER